jgi:hypothetical protein
MLTFLDVANDFAKMVEKRRAIHDEVTTGFVATVTCSARALHRSVLSRSQMERRNMAQQGRRDNRSKRSPPDPLHVSLTAVRKVWYTPLAGGPVVGNPSLDGAGVLAVSTFARCAGAQNALYLTDESNGAILRTIPYPEPLFAQPVLPQANSSSWVPPFRPIAPESSAAFSPAAGRSRCARQRLGGGSPAYHVAQVASA